jgi:hypothetical protein
MPNTRTPLAKRNADSPVFHDLRDFSALVDFGHGSDVLVICFANAPMPRHALSPGPYWGAGFMAGRGLDHICLSGRAETWFRSDDIADFLSRVTADSGHRRILTYGISKGGTAALWHAGAAGATEVFACVPQVVPDAYALARGDDRWIAASHYDWPEDDLARSLAHVAQVTIVTDQRNAFEAAYLADLHRVWRQRAQVVDLRYAGHDGAAMLGRQHALSRLFDMVVAGIPDPATLREITECRKSEPGYYRNLLACRRVSGSAWLSGIVQRAAAVRGIDPMSVRMDSGYRKLAKMGRY